MKTLGALLVLALFSGEAFAQGGKKLGLGLILGNPTGGSAKYWLSETQAFDAALGFSGDLEMHADYLWHAWNAFPQPPQGKLGLYLGAGPRLELKDDNEFGIRGVFGATYLVDKYPWDVFLEVVPVLRVTPGPSMGLDAALGGRYYF
jgi:hypothetical protein